MATKIDPRTLPAGRVLDRAVHASLSGGALAPESAPHYSTDPGWAMVVLSSLAMMSHVSVWQDHENHRWHCEAEVWDEPIGGPDYWRANGNGTTLTEAICHCAVDALAYGDDHGGGLAEIVVNDSPMIIARDPHTGLAICPTYLNESL